MSPDTISHRLLAQAQRRPNEIAYYAKSSGEWRATTWRQYANDVRSAARALCALGVSRGSQVAILGFNRPEWVTFNHAAMMAGGAAAGIYTTCSADEVAYIVDHSEARVVLVEDNAQWQKIRAKRSQLPRLLHVVAMRGATIADDDSVLSWDEFMARGTQLSDTEIDARLALLQDDDLATLIYTSGTTGPPKGVMLSHRNLAWTASKLIELGGSRAGDCGLSYLPLSHIAEQMGSIHVPATSGATVYFAESIERVADNLKEVRPTVFFGVPRIWEKFHAALSSRLGQTTGVKARLIAYTQRVCTQVNAYRCRGETLPRLLRLQYQLVDRLVLQKLKQAIGFDRMRMCISGAAPIGRDIIEFFASIDLVMYEIYGQSEDSGPTAFNLPGKTKFGTVGQAVPGVEVSLADDGEILIRGPNVFLGYFKEPAATAEAMHDGWLRSGDLGEFDRDGYLSITGRKKEIIITAGGKNIAPKNIEAGIKQSPLVSEVVVIGDRRKFLTALIALDDTAADAWQRGGANVRDELQRVVDDVNLQLARVEQIKRFTILPRPFAMETGELTPTLKIRRKVVDVNFAEQIEAMYIDEPR